MASPKVSISWGLINTALSSRISGIEVVLEAITGVPQAMASKGGRPKPS